MGHGDAWGTKRGKDAALGWVLLGPQGESEG